MRATRPPHSFPFPIPAAVVLVALFASGCGDGASPGSGAPPSAGGIQQGTLIEIEQGAVQGHVDGGARRFLGIPFAQPPVGALRWASPRRAGPWDGILVADEMSEPCAQEDALTTPASENEDCLYLNIWTPDRALEEPLPVLFWIHGGGNSSGSTADEIPLGVGGLFYDGRSLAENRDVVVVSTNYRLNVFGFLSHPALAAEDASYPYSGNQGLQDQRMALEWVRDNIRAFGGDPGNVTIFGESAGSFNVCYHIVSPQSRGLFHRGIGQSGGCTFRNPTLEEAHERTGRLLESTGCDGADDALRCLREQPVSALLSASGGFGPAVDGGVVPEQPRVLFDRGAFAKVPYVLGSNSDEGTLFLLQTPPVQTEEEYRVALEARYGERAPEIAATYPVADFANPNDALARATGDAVLVCGTYDTARRAAAGGADVWLYNFSWPVLTDILPFLRATHGAEIAFVFGSAESPTPADAAISESMQGYWSRFARRGDPNGDGALDWPRYEEATDRRINFDADNTILTGFRREECEMWWRFADEDFE